MKKIKLLEHIPVGTEVFIKEDVSIKATGNDYEINPTYSLSKVIDDTEQVTYILEKEIKNLNLIIPENAYNGDVIKAIFPDLIFEEYNYIGDDGLAYQDIVSDNMRFDNEFWNSPYKRFLYDFD